jgi:hypothetical protein
VEACTVYGDGYLSKEWESRLRKGGLSTEVDTCLRRGRVVYGEGGLSTEVDTGLRRGRVVYAGGESSTEG